MFELLTPTDAVLTSFTGRCERHGEDDVPALSFKLKFSGPNTLLNLLSPTLLDTLFMAVESQEDLPGVEVSRPLLRSKDITRVPLDEICYEGWTATVEHGINEESALVMGGSKIDDFKVDLHNGGTVDIECRVSTADIGPGGVGLLWSKQKRLVSVLFKAPKIQEPAIDGTEGHQGLKKTKRKKADDSQPDLVGDDKPLNTAGDGETRADDAGSSDKPAELDDKLLAEARELVIANKRASISLVQRTLKVGYNRAARLLEALEKAGVVSAMSTDGNREVLMQAAPAEEPVKSATDQFLDRHAPATTH